MRNLSGPADNQPAFVINSGSRSYKVEEYMGRRYFFISGAAGGKVA